MEGGQDSGYTDVRSVARVGLREKVSKDPGESRGAGRPPLHTSLLTDTPSLEGQKAACAPAVQEL